MESTVLAAVSIHSVHHTILLSRALIVHDRGLRSPEEPLAALAGDDAIVDSRRLVAAHLAGNDLNLGCERGEREGEKGVLVKVGFEGHKVR